jgi:hypothetical protein
MAPETDGPLGALILSKALNSTLGVNTVMIAEKETLNLISAMERSINLFKDTSDDYLTLLGFPKDTNSANEYSVAILDEFLPSAVIAIEKVGRNRRGIYHNMRGYDISSSSIKVDQLFINADMRNILTIGIGDGGNEIGMSGIAEVIKQHIPHGAVCNCPCGSGITCDTETDYLITADVSNWGAYGLAACLSAITENIESLHNGESERNLLSIACDNGALDGVTGKCTPSADGLTYQTHVYVVELLKELVQRIF